ARRGASKGVASRRRAAARSSAAGTKRNSASRSMNRLINQGQATRSTLTCSRVIQRMARLVLAFFEAVSADTDHSVAGLVDSNLRPLRAAVWDGEVEPVLRGE